MPDLPDQPDRKMTRRQALGAGAGAFAALAAGGYGVSRASDGAAKPAADIVLRAQPTTVELGARRAATWTYDGQPVEHVETDALLMGMGERYDVLVDIDSSDARRLIAMPSGKRGQAMAILRPVAATSAVPAAGAPFTTPKRMASYNDLRSPGAPPVAAAPRVTRFDLAMKGAYGWTMGGQLYEDADIVKLKRGEAQRFVMRNTTGMAHPMHLHGHSFRVAGSGVLKDTVMVLPQQEVSIDFVADNPGDWAFHCHNVFHMEAGMMRKVRVSS